MPNELHTAAADKNGLATVKSLIANGVPINQLHTVQKTRPVEFAAQSGSLGTLQYLLKMDADIDASNSKRNLLYWALDNGRDVIEYVSSPGNHIIDKFNDGTTYFHAAIASGQFKAVKTALKKDPTLVFTSNSKTIRPLKWAYLSKQNEIANLLIEYLSYGILFKAEKYDECITEIANYSIRLSQDNKTSHAIIVMDNLIKHCQQAKINDVRLSELHCDLAIFGLNIDNFTLAKTNYDIAFSYYQTSDANIAIKSGIEESLEQINRHLNLGPAAKDRGFICKDVKADGACFYHALIDQLIGLKKTEFETIDQTQLRTLASDHIRNNADIYKPFIHYNNTQDKEFDDFVEKILLHDTWADHITILALSRELNMNFVIIKANGDNPQIIKQPQPIATLYFGYIEGLHYQSLHRYPTYQITKPIDMDSAEVDIFNGKIINKKNENPKTENLLEFSRALKQIGQFPDRNQNIPLEQTTEAEKEDTTDTENTREFKKMKY